ncbi:hypothetical protein [Candidatus Sororendozoicomonas aggregata]|uniref:hypothetical protein n=1 Tax=Candidatus Sororendozoicomonas aggregata TaxID=3073239 RepID=UPI002ECFC252
MKYINYFIFAYIFFSLSAFAEIQEKIVLGKDSDTVFLVTRHKIRDPSTGDITTTTTASRKKILNLSDYDFRRGEGSLQFKSSGKYFVVYTWESPKVYVFSESAESAENRYEYREIDKGLDKSYVEIKHEGDNFLVYAWKSPKGFLFTKDANGRYTHREIEKGSDTGHFEIKKVGEYLLVYTFTSPKGFLFTKDANGRYTHREIEKGSDRGNFTITSAHNDCYELSCGKTKYQLKQNLLTSVVQ